MPSPLPIASPHSELRLSGPQKAGPCCLSPCLSWLCSGQQIRGGGRYNKSNINKILKTTGGSSLRLNQSPLISNCSASGPLTFRLPPPFSGAEQRRGRAGDMFLAIPSPPFQTRTQSSSKSALWPSYSSFLFSCLRNSVWNFLLLPVLTCRRRIQHERVSKTQTEAKCQILFFGKEGERRHGPDSTDGAGRW